MGCGLGVFARGNGSVLSGTFESTQHEIDQIDSLIIDYGHGDMFSAVWLGFSVFLNDTPFVSQSMRPNGSREKQLRFASSPLPRSE